MEGRKSCFKGVYPTGSGTRENLGTYAEEEDAARVYDKRLIGVAGLHAVTSARLGLYPEPDTPLVAPRSTPARLSRQGRPVPATDDGITVTEAARHLGWSHRTTKRAAQQSQIRSVTGSTGRLRHSLEDVARLASRLTATSKR